MKNLLILLCVAMICISATTITKTIYQPAIPKMVRHKVFIDQSQSVDSYIADCIKSGYIIKQIAVGETGQFGGFSTIIVIAERY